MNIIKIFVEIERKKGSEPIKLQIIDDFKRDSNNPENYVEECQNKWRQEKNNLRSLYSIGDLVVSQNRQSIQYYIFDPSQAGSSDAIRKTFEILIISDIDNIDGSFDIVISDIKKILKHKVTKVLKENNIFLFPFNTSEGDIYAPDRIIKAKFKQKNVWSKPELWRFWIIFAVSLILFVLHLVFNYKNINDDEIKSVFISIYTTGFIFCLSEFIFKLVDRKTGIAIDNLADFIRENPKLPFGEDVEEAIQSPTE